MIDGFAEVMMDNDIKNALNVNVEQSIEYLLRASYAHLS